MGSAVDDRNICGSQEDVMRAYADITQLATAAGHDTNPNKQAMTATTAKGRQILAKLNIGTTDNPVAPRVFLTEKVVEDVISIQTLRSCILIRAGQLRNKRSCPCRSAAMLQRTQPEQ